jgi:phosphopantothenoylcysteine synthetase/decarboxylase
MLHGKNIVLGVTGGIAAYKAVEIVSRLKKAGAAVHVIMTEEATKFVTPLTFRELSTNPVAVQMWEEPKTWNIEHIALATKIIFNPIFSNLLLLSSSNSFFLLKIKRLGSCPKSFIN